MFSSLFLIHLDVIVQGEGGRSEVRSVCEPAHCEHVSGEAVRRKKVLVVNTQTYSVQKKHFEIILLRFQCPDVSLECDRCSVFIFKTYFIYNPD